MTLDHRPVDPADLPLLCTFPQNARELFFLFPTATYPLTIEPLAAAIARRVDSTVVTLDGAVAGFANFARWPPEAPCTLGNVMVAPALRGRGVGRYLIETMIEIAFARHSSTEVRVACFCGNTAGLLLYHRSGFQPFALEERGDPTGNRVALVHLRLAPIK